jgi:hypothetical protein
VVLIIGGKNMKMMSIEMPDGSKWAVPVDVIARHRAAHYAHEFDGDIERSLAEDTGPLFAGDQFEIKDWASNNMSWSDVRSVAMYLGTEKSDYQEGWVNGAKSIFESAKP